jgi:AraC-like DNA-binding protein
MILHIKNMVCLHCIMALKQLLKELGISYNHIELGAIVLNEKLSKEKLEELSAGLHTLGLALIDDRRSRIIEKIKTTIINLMHDKNEEKPNQNISSILFKELNYDYNYLSSLFSESEGITIEKFVIAQRIDRVKELLVYDELTLSEIAYKLGYTSTAHLSNQFKKITGLTPSYLKKIKKQKEDYLELAKS